MQATLLPKYLVEVVVVAHLGVIDHPVPEIGKLLRKEVVGRGDDLVQVRRNLSIGSDKHVPVHRNGRDRGERRGVFRNILPFRVLIE